MRHPARISAPVVVAVVSWNTRELLRSCLASLAADASSGLASVWVVDNASSDRSAAMARSEFEWASVLEPGDNLGFGPAVNLVAERTDSEWIAASNADVELHPGALARLLDAGRRRPGTGLVAPRLVRPDGSTEHSVFPFPTLGTNLFLSLGLPRVAPRAADRRALVGYWDPARAREVDWAVGAFLLLRREAFDAVGGFDPRQWMYAEDLDLGWRLARASRRAWYEPSAVVTHAGSAAAEQAFGDDAVRRERWMEATYEWMVRRRGRARTAAVAAVATAGAAARSVFGDSAARPWTRLHARGLARALSRGFAPHK